MSEKKAQSRNRKKWYRQEVNRVMRLLSLGYEAEEVGEHIGRSTVSIAAMLKGYDTGVAELRARAIYGDKRAMLSLPPLPPYNLDSIFKPVEDDLPHLFAPTQVAEPIVTQEERAMILAEAPEDGADVPFVSMEEAVEDMQAVSGLTPEILGDAPPLVEEEASEVFISDQPGAAVSVPPLEIPEFLTKKPQRAGSTRRAGS